MVEVTRRIEAHDLLDTEEVAARLGVTARSLRTMRSQAHRHPRIASMPPPLRLVSGRPVWRAADIDAWLSR